MRELLPSTQSDKSSSIIVHMAIMHRHACVPSRTRSDIGRCYCQLLPPGAPFREGAAVQQPSNHLPSRAQLAASCARVVHRVTPSAKTTVLRCEHEMATFTMGRPFYTGVTLSGVGKDLAGPPNITASMPRTPTDRMTARRGDLVTLLLSFPPPTPTGMLPA